MRILRIKLTDYRGIRDKEVVFPAQGVIRLEGPNEAGKSSLLEAVEVLRLYKHSSNHRDVKATQPADRDVPTVVEAELQVGPYRFTYRKQFHKRAATELTIHAPKPESLRGHEAHDRVTGIFAEHVDTALLEALWIRQDGDRSLPSLTEAKALGRALDRAAGGASDDGGGEDLYAAVRAEHQRYFTRLGAESKELRAADARVEALHEQLTELKRREAEVEDDARTIEALRRRLVDDAAFVVEQRATVDRLNEQLAEAEARRRALDAAAAQHAVAAATAREIDGQRKARREQARVAADAREALTQLQAARAGASSGEVDATATERAADAAEEAARAREGAAARAEAEAEASQRRAADEAEHASLDERCGRAEAADALARSASAWVDACAVTPDAVTELDRLDQAVARAEAALAAGAPRVRLEALADLQLQSPDGDRSLAVGEVWESTVAAAWQAELPGSLRVRVEPGSGLERPQRAAVAAREALAAALRRLELAGVAEARDLLGERQAQQTRAAEATRDRDAALRESDGGRVTLDELRARRDALAVRLAEAGPAAEGDASEQSVAQARAARRTAAEELAAAVAEHARSSEALKGRRAELASLDQQLTRATEAATRAAEAVAAMAAQGSDAQLDQSAAEAAAALAAAEARVVALTAALASDQPEGLTARRDNLAQALADRERARDGRRDELAKLGGRLEAMAERGLGEQAQQKQGALTVAERSRDRLRRRADAARVLFEAFDEARSAAREAWRAPLQERIEQLGRLVFGASLQVELDEDLAVVARTLDGVTLPFGSLSNGAREQLGLIARMAAAALVSDDGGMPLLLDDALGFTDAERLEPLAALLAQAGKVGQVVLLTCTPERFAQVGGTTVVEMP